MQERQSGGVEWVATLPRVWAEGVVRVAGGPRGSQGIVDGSLNIIISYHVQEVCSKVVTFEEK